MLEEFNGVIDVIYKKTDANLVICYQESLCNIIDFIKDIYPRLLENKYKAVDELIPGIAKKIKANANLEKLIYSGLLLAERNGIVYSFDLAKPPTRPVQDSLTESESPFSSRDGFVESYKTNIALIRTRIKTNDLIIDELDIGRISKTTVAILSIKEIQNEKIKKDLINDLKKIDVDAIINPDDLISAFGKQGIFTGYQYIGSPDIATRRLLNGEFLILIDRLSIVLAVPISITIASRMPVENLNIPIFTVLERLFVFICFFISTMFLGILSSVVTYQNDILSLNIISILKTTQSGVIIPIGLELIIIILIFELFYLISFRQAKSVISGTVLLIGGIIIGENLITSGLAGVFIITMAAISFLSGFVISSNATIISSISIIRLIFLISSFYFGIYGVSVASLLVGAIIYKKKLYEINYFYPFLPFSVSGIYRFLLPTSSKRNNMRNKLLVKNNRRNKK